MKADIAMNVCEGWKVPAHMYSQPLRQVETGEGVTLNLCPVCIFVLEFDPQGYKERLREMPKVLRSAKLMTEYDVECNEALSLDNLMMQVIMAMTIAFEQLREYGPKDLTHIWTNPDKDLIFEGVPKPEGPTVELAKVILYMFTLAEAYKMDILGALRVQMGYNKVRPQRHGGKHV